ncbi:MAG: hypothetical protein K0S44_2039 [Bacteroidetes bacterium]|jgi:hypothetical protein|nr:hypothetical protein [Bacteroidota bacterium]
MKTNSTTLAIAILGIATILGSCQKEELKPMPVISTQSETVTTNKKTLSGMNDDFEKNLYTGKWVISNMNDGKYETRTDQTAHFRDYVFTFNEYQVVIATSKERSVSGKWTTIMVGNKKKVVVDFGFKPFIILNGHWDITEFNTAYVKLNIPQVNGSAVLNFDSVNNMPK